MIDISVSNLVKEFEVGNKILDGLSFQVDTGERVGLLGKNGAGKTTLLSILTAQNTKDAGSVTYDGQDVWENQHALDQICFSRELETTLFSSQNNLKVRHYLRSAAIFFPHWDQDYAQRLMEEFHVEPKKKISQLSKGQLSMVTILIALASGAPITILDEPAAGLDPEGRDTILSQVKQFHQETGTTVVLVSHSMEDIAKYADKVLVLDAGHVAMYDTTSAVFARADELLQLGLSVPEVTKVFLRLREWGLDVPADVYTVPYAANILRGMLEKGAGTC